MRRIVPVIITLALAISLIVATIGAVRSSGPPAPDPRRPETMPGFVPGRVKVDLPVSIEEASPAADAGIRAHRAFKMHHAHVATMEGRAVQITYWAVNDPDLANSSGPPSILEVRLSRKGDKTTTMEINSPGDIFSRYVNHKIHYALGLPADGRPAPPKIENP
jgi:hypothetical protein